jgi:transketolase
MNSPTALILSRQKLPTLDVSLRDKEFNYGNYAVKDTGKKADLLLLASLSTKNLSFIGASHNVPVFLSIVE